MVIHQAKLQVRMKTTRQSSLMDRHQARMRLQELKRKKTRSQN